VELYWAGKAEVLGGGGTWPLSTDRTWSDLGSNPGLRSERPATTSLSHGTAISAQISRV
jgi:hypothetical protein